MSDMHYYRTPHWRRLRVAALQRDAYTCTAPGCRERATHVDHIVSRRNGGTDTLSNLRCLCAAHDNQVKEQYGARRKGGVLKAIGCDVDGWPRWRQG